jgi:hypothetical protein
MSQVNDYERCAAGCADCASQQRLMLLAGKLTNRGLETHFDTCDTGTKSGHCDSVTATNPAAPERGAFHIDSDGCVEWTFPGAELGSDDGIGRIVDEAINALRASGVRLPRRQAKES